MKIEYLSDHTEHVATLARWFHDEWGYLSPDYTLEERTERLYAKANRNGIPIAFVAMETGEPIGSASLVQCDMDVRSHLTPWLSSVYVRAVLRENSIGPEIIELSRSCRYQFSAAFTTITDWLRKLTPISDSICCFEVAEPE